MIMNMFFVKNRSVHNYNTRNKDKLRPTVAKHAYRDRDFRLVGVHVWNYIAANLKMGTSFFYIQKSTKNIIQSEICWFNLKLYIFTSH